MTSQLPTVQRNGGSCGIAVPNTRRLYMEAYNSPHLLDRISSDNPLLLSFE